MRRIVLVYLLFAGASAFAQEDRIQLKNAPGRDVVANNCQTCHSLDYIVMNSPFLDRKGWETSVNKMVKAMGAPIPEDQIPRIVDYLATNYGKQ